MRSELPQRPILEKLECQKGEESGIIHQKFEILHENSIRYQEERFEQCSNFGVSEGPTCVIEVPKYEFVERVIQIPKIRYIEKAMHGEVDIKAEELAPQTLVNNGVIEYVQVVHRDSSKMEINEDIIAEPRGELDENLAPEREAMTVPLEQRTAMIEEELSVICDDHRSNKRYESQDVQDSNSDDEKMNEELSTAKMGRLGSKSDQMLDGMASLRASDGPVGGVDEGSACTWGGHPQAWW